MCQKALKSEETKSEKVTEATNVEHTESKIQ